MLEEKLKKLSEKSNIVEPAVIDVEVPYSEKVPEQTVQDIKTVYSPNPVQNVQETQSDPSPSPSPSFDMKRIRSEVNQMTPKESNMDLLMGLIPLATSYIAGGRQGEGVGVAADYYTNLVKEGKARSNSLEDKLMELEKARMIASGKLLGKNGKLATASNLVPVVSEDGSIKYEWAGQAAGKEVAQKPKTGLSFEERLNLQKKSQEFRKSEKDETERIGAGARFQSKLESDKDFLDYKNQARNAQRALELLSQGKGVSDAGTRTVFAKGIFGDVGNIAVQEAAAVSGAPDYLSRYQTLRDSFFKGTRFSDADRADLVQISLMIKENAPKVIEKIAMKKAEAEQKISGIDVSKVAQSLSRDVTSGEVKVKVIYNGRVKAIDIENYPEAVRKYGAKLFTGKE